MKKLIASVMLTLPFTMLAEAPKEEWDVVTKAVWERFKSSPHMIDACALKLAHKIDVDKRTGWPAYCNDYENTETVKNRVADLEKVITILDLPQDKYERIRNGDIWINAPEELVILALGSPVDTSKSTTAAGVKKTWRYSGGKTIFLENGRLIEIRE